MAAASAVADSLPFDERTTKSELLRQLRLHEASVKAQRGREGPAVRSVGPAVMVEAPASQNGCSTQQSDIHDVAVICVAFASKREF